MRIQLIAAGKRQPVWINDGYEEYARRLKGSCKRELTESPLGHRSRTTLPDKARDSEGRRMLRAIPTAAHVVALTVDGQAWSTIELAERLSSWTLLGKLVCLLVGGPAGLAADVLQRAAERCRARGSPFGCATFTFGRDCLPRTSDITRAHACFALRARRFRHAR